MDLTRKLAELALDDEGRVVLGDAELEELSKEFGPVMAGGVNRGCVNNGCVGTGGGANQGCTNNDCNGTSNTRCENFEH